MEKTAVQKLASVLRVMVWIVLAVNLLCLLLVPFFACLVADGNWYSALRYLRENLPDYTIHTLGHMLMACPFAFLAVWSDWSSTLITIVFGVCGVCTAVILWQAKKVLDTILAGEPFQMSNANALNRAAVCCWIISGTALVQLVWRLWYDRTLAPFFSYNALFVPGFLMAGLLFQVMSALFRQAAELREDQDLTI